MEDKPHIPPELLDQIHRLYVGWCRLKGHKPAKSPLDHMIDETTGRRDALMAEFADFFFNDIMARLPPPESE